ncbi:hypothetical protein [Streptomyces niveus]|uniref:hypothetical protein n=1 Tax=Streptomyces niveus TaxID=193462 RepID=UPI0036D3AA07
MTAGVWWRRIGLASSPKATSLVQWTVFSMIRWPRAPEAMSAGDAWWAGRSVTV